MREAAVTTSTSTLLREMARERVCVRPRRSTNSDTGSLVHARCMSQNERVCPSCASLNRMYSMRLIGSGCNVNENDGITENMLSSFAFYFVTLTAPSFKSTHKSGSCRCGFEHGKTDSIVSTPIDFKSYRWRDQVEWNRDSSALFHHSIDELKRAIPDIEWTAAREWQKRGAIHFHIIVRASRELEQGQVWSELVKLRTRRLGGTTWGQQIDVKQIKSEGVSKSVGYMAKVISYTAKSQVEGDGGRERLMMRDRLTRAAQRIRCKRRDCVPAKCQGRAHGQFGYAGHLRSSSRGWSLIGLTKQALHEQRHAFARQMSGATDWQTTITAVQDTDAVETLHMVDRIHDRDEWGVRQRYVEWERISQDTS